MAEKIYPSGYTQLTPVIGTEKIMAARSSDGKMFWILASDLLVDISNKVDKDGTKVLSDVNFSTAKDTKLTGIATGATANSTDANLRSRANHTGTQTADTITDGTTNKVFTATEKSKLANINQYFVGRYASLSALQAAHPTGSDGEYATIDVVGQDAKQYIWDATDTKWVTGAVGAGSVASVNGQTGAVSLNADDVPEGSTSLYFTVARVIAAALSGYTPGSTHVAVVATDSIIQALQKLSGSIAAANTVIAGKEATITAGNTSQLWIGDKTWASILSTVQGVVLTNLSTASSTVITATDTMIVAFGKLQAQITLRSKIAVTVGTSTALTFTEDNIQGSVGTPLTGNITGVTTGSPVVGVVVHVVHNHTSAPTFDSKFKKLSGSGNYVTGQINHIYCEYMSATEILYTIQQRA